MHKGEKNEGKQEDPFTIWELQLSYLQHLKFCTDSGIQKTNELIIV